MAGAGRLRRRPSGARLGIAPVRLHLSDRSGESAHRDFRPWYEWHRPSDDALSLAAQEERWSWACIDHSGYLPRLVQEGFRGEIWCTRATAELAAILLPDAGRLQEEEARHANRHRTSKHHPALPLFTEDDALRAVARLRPVPSGKAFDPTPGLAARFSPAGHILGASSVHLSTGGASVLFSGDLGRADDVIMRPPAPPVEADHVVIESTYGDRRHSTEDPADVLADVVVRTCRRGGTVLVPVFAVGRAQTLLHLLTRLRADGRIPEVPTFLNSPLAVNATEIFAAASGDDHRLSAAEVQAMGDGVELVRTVEASKELTSRAGPMIVLSASGMLTGGRVLHHLLRAAPDRRSTILLTGFQAAGTRGRALLDGAESVRVFGQDVPVRAEVVHLDSLSAHADADGLLAWLRSAPVPPRSISVVHGEPRSAETLRRRIEHELGIQASTPEVGDRLLLPAGAVASG